MGETIVGKIEGYVGVILGQVQISGKLNYYTYLQKEIVIMLFDPKSEGKLLYTERFFTRAKRLRLFIELPRDERPQ